METKQELEAWLKRLQDKWNSGQMSSPDEVGRLDRQMKELKKKLLTLK